MKKSAYHLNLLMENERLSSSPVRFRVMMPILAGLAALGIAVWWLILFSQVILAQSNVSRLKNEMKARDGAHRQIKEKMAQVNEFTAELAQLDCYSNSIVRRGELLTSLAEAMPLKVQLLKLEIPEPEPPKLPEAPKPPPGKKKKKAPVFVVHGPTGYVERATLVLTGRSPKDPPVFALMESLSGDAFTNALVVTHDPRHPDPSPRVRSFRQETTGNTRGKGATRMVAFDIEYRLPERRFDK